MAMNFQFEGQKFMAINGGPHFRFNEAISLFVDCEDQEELGRLWDQLLEGGQTQQRGWLKDRYGLSWQINRSILPEMLQEPDPGDADDAGHDQDRHRRTQARL